MRTGDLLFAFALVVSTSSCHASIEARGPKTGSETVDVDKCEIVLHDKGSRRFDATCGRDVQSVEIATSASSLDQFLRSKRKVYIELGVVNMSVDAIRLTDQVLRELSTSADIRQSDGSPLPLSGKVVLQELDEILISEQDEALLISLRASSYTIVASSNARGIAYDYILH